MNDKVEHFKSLQEKADKLKSKKIALEERQKTKKEDLKKVVKEVKAMGYEPNKLGQVIKEKEAALEKEIETFEKDLTEVSEKLSEIEG